LFESVYPWLSRFQYPRIKLAASQIQKVFIQTRDEKMAALRQADREHLPPGRDFLFVITLTNIIGTLIRHAKPCMNTCLIKG
jgi:hypothetical protein